MTRYRVVAWGPLDAVILAASVGVAVVALAIR